MIFLMVSFMQDDTYTESYISTIGVDFVGSGAYCMRRARALIHPMSKKSNHRRKSALWSSTERLSSFKLWDDVDRFITRKYIMTMTNSQWSFLLSSGTLQDRRGSEPSPAATTGERMASSWVKHSCYMTFHDGVLKSRTLVCDPLFRWCMMWRTKSRSTTWSSGWMRSTVMQAKMWTSCLLVSHICQSASFTECISASFTGQDNADVIL